MSLAGHDSLPADPAVAVVVSGLPRYGTSMVMQMLASQAAMLERNDQSSTARHQRQLAAAYLQNRLSGYPSTMKLAGRPTARCELPVDQSGLVLNLEV